MNNSLFHIYTVGKAAANKKTSSKELSVYPIEVLGYVDGEITDAVEEEEVSGEDAFGNKYQVKAASSAAITATWIPFGSNRKTPPDIRRGERVVIWRYGDSDSYYWSETGLDEYLRRLETVIYTFSNTRDETVKELTPDNSWYIELSTHTKMITLQTNKSDGEKVAYTFQFDINSGSVILSDDLGNYVEIDSLERIVTLKNGDDSILELNKTIITAKSTDKIILDSKTIDFNSQTQNVTTKSLNVSASTSVWKSPTITITGNVTSTGTFGITGATTIAGALGTSGGAVTMTANMTITGNISTTGALTNNTKNIGSTHTHNGVHGATTAPV